MGRPRIVAILVGFVADVVSSTLLALAFSLIVLLVYVAQGDSAEHATQMLTKDSYTSTPLLLMSGGVGAMGSLIGGFVSGWLAKYNRVFNGIITGICSVLFGVFFWKTYPLWYDCLGVLLTIGPAATGAYFAALVFGDVTPPPVRQIIVHP